MLTSVHNNVATRHEPTSTSRIRDHKRDESANRLSRCEPMDKSNQLLDPTLLSGEGCLLSGRRPILPFLDPSLGLLVWRVGDHIG